jgi:eukaryotic-like serine/threonine-protein kinase
MTDKPAIRTDGADERADGRRGPDGLTGKAIDVAADGEEERRLFEILTAYLQAVESGHHPSRDALLANHPEFAVELKAFLDEEDHLHRLVRPVRRVNERPDGSNGGAPASSFANTPHSPAPSAGALERIAGSASRDFGDYELLELIGSGGMGVVFRARQKSLDRQVAVKMIRGGDLAAEDDLRRFRLESGASAQLDHPHIVPIYEVGEHQGYCYYVMKLMGGGSLEKRLHEFASDPRRAARLVVTVARAVHHAHQRGVLHRDLKPGNILIDDEGRGHVADFGLAKRLGVHADATQTGLIVGTPSYMAPEQATGKKDAVTTATDVYGLGALLYSLLSGRPPFRGDSILETIEQVRIREPEPPTSVGTRVDRDLQTICLTCLRKEPNRRYASAAALADDLERWDAGEPIAARPTRTGERAWRWARREPLSAALAAALAVLALVVVAGLVVSNVMISRERDEAQTQRRIAQDESRHAQLERQRALDRSRQARQAVDEMYTEVAEKWLYEQPKLSKVQRDFLEKARAFYEQFSREEGDDPEVQLARAKAISRLAWVQFRLGHPQDGEASLYKPVTILQELADRHPERPEFWEALGQAWGTLGSHFSEQKRWKEANNAAERAVATYEKLVKLAPAEAAYRIALATHQAQLGVQYQFSGRVEEAQRLGLLGLASLNRLHKELPERSDPHDLSARMHLLEDVGCVLVENRRFDEAEKALRESIDIGEHLPERVISHQDLLHRIAHTNMYLGYTLGRVGRWPEAQTNYARAKALFERLTADFPDLPLYQTDVIDAELGLIDVDVETGRRSTAEQSLQEQVQRSERLAAAHPELVNCRRTLLAALMRLCAQCSEKSPAHDAEAAFRRASAVAEGLVAVEPSGIYPRYRLARAELRLSEFLAASGRGVEALVPIRRAVATLEKLTGDCASMPEYQQALADGLMALGELRLEAGHQSEAEHAFHRAMELYRKIEPQADCDPELADRCMRGFISCALPRFRDPDRALSLSRRAASRFPHSTRLKSSLGIACYRAGDWKGAVTSLSDAHKSPDPGDAADLLVLAMAHHQSGETAEAQACYERAASSMTRVTRARDTQRLQAEAKALFGHR